MSDNTNYTYSDRFQQFVKKLASFSTSGRSSSTVDNNPTDIFTGEAGELLTKYKELIFYRKVNSDTFVSLSDDYKTLIETNKFVLSQGINKYATWQKKDGPKDWDFVGYFTPICDMNCCPSGSVNP